MKWIFVILVSLNLIVFASTIIHKMNTRGQAKVDPQGLQEGIKGLSQRGGSDYLEVVSLKDDEAKEERARELAREKEEASRRQPARRESGVRPQAGGNSSRNDTPATSIYVDPPKRKSCNNSSIVLEDTTYHRIKMLLNSWPHVASRQVVPNTKAASRTMYYVVVPGSPTDENLLRKLRSVRLNPQISNGQIILGKFSNRRAASSVQARVSSEGVRTNIQEKSEGGDKNAPLSQVVYRVVFNNLSDDQARQVQNIVAPYGNLQRIKCD